MTLDLLYTKDSSGETFAFLNQVDDATTLQVLTLVNDRNSSTITSALVKGWFQHYGLPETLLVDAEGAMKSFAFDELMAQSNIMVRFVPPDAHWQMGKCERHGDAARAILNKLVDQHGLLGAEDMQTGAVMACFAKNTLARRAGSSPAQWALGQNPRLPAAVLSEGDNPEAMERLTLSNKLQQIENLRFDAMHAFLSFENENALRQSMLRRSRPWRGPYMRSARSRLLPPSQCLGRRRISTWLSSRADLGQGPGHQWKSMASQRQRPTGASEPRTSSMPPRRRDLAPR